MSALTTQQLTDRLQQLPRVQLAELPTPLHDCAPLAQKLGVRQFLMKRDDLTGLAFGGNKTRKFDYTFGEILRQGCDTVITGAAAQSNHSRQAAAACAKLGLKCYLVNRWDHRARLGIQGNFLLDCILGAEVRLIDGDFQEEAKQKLADELRAQGRQPYVIGDYAAALGAAAYAGGVAEIVGQAASLSGFFTATPTGKASDAQRPPCPTLLALASGNGTQSGVALGVKALELDWRVQGFRPSNSSDDATAAGNIAACANEAAEILRLDTKVSRDDIHNTRDYVGEAYGYTTPAALDAIELVARTTGIILDPVYTAKAMAGVIDYVKTSRISKDATIIFLHTGGASALFAYAPEFVEHGKYRAKVIESLDESML